jgi:LPPG:FO 2-phospho-L-lactate transferase
MHLHRTRALRAGVSLTAVTATLARALGVVATILPMTDAPVRTRLRTPDGWLDFQEYFVRDKARPQVLEVEYAGAGAAAPTSAVLESLAHADLIIVCPSNPVTSVGPILAVPGIVEALGTTSAQVVAVSPIVGGAAVSGPAGELMRARGLAVTSAGVATAYAPWLDTMVVDVRDGAHAAALREAGIAAVVTETIMRDHAGEVALAQALLGVRA